MNNLLPTRPYFQTVISAAYATLRVDLFADELTDLLAAWQDWKAGQLSEPIYRIATGPTSRSDLLHLDLTTVVAIQHPPVAANQARFYPSLARPQTEARHRQPQDAGPFPLSFQKGSQP